MGILEKISEIEKEISRTQKNKGKNYIMCNKCIVHKLPTIISSPSSRTR